MKYIVDSNTDIFIKAYRSFLKSEGEMSIEQFIRLYQKMQPGLHKYACEEKVDIEAFIYSYLRLPQIMPLVKNVVLGQTDEIFRRDGYAIDSWEEVSAPARRRKMYFNGIDTLVIFINSVTDVDDIVCLLTAFQIEWNKLHAALKGKKVDDISLYKKLNIDKELWSKLVLIWNENAEYWLNEITHKECLPRLRLLHGSYVDYERAAQRWLENIFVQTRYKNIKNQPLYFVSSNTHSLVNSITGWVNTKEDILLTYLKQKKLNLYLDYWEKIKSGSHPGSKENFLWYVLKKYEKENPDVKQERVQYEHRLGIDYIEAKHFLDINAQVISVRNLVNADIQNKVDLDLSKLTDSEALILNIDYPLGYGAYMVLSTVLRNVNKLQGVYILGKASFLNGNLGDIGIPTTVFDSYGENLYIFKNVFTKEYFHEFKTGSVLVDQQAVSTKGTLLHPENVIKDYFMEGYTIVEMENGSYLNALYEMTHYEKYPQRDVINLTTSPLDIGIIHYASDTPFTKAITLGTRNLGYEGVEATYTSSLAILRRIIERELSS